MSKLGAGTRLYALLGDPVEHSLSPTLQNAALEAAGLDAVYVALRITKELVAPVMRAVAAAGGGGNVTVPHKRAAAQALDHPSDAVRATGACNLFWWEEGRGLCGGNSDVEAFGAAAEAVLGSTLLGCRILVLGAGGGARSVVYACMLAKAAAVHILNRTRDHAEALARDVGGDAHIHVLSGPHRLSSEPYDLVVNATPVGLDPTDPPPLDLNLVGARAVLDLVYSREGTAWVSDAQLSGIPAEDGRRMLVLQAAASFAKWFDREPPLRAMAEAVGLHDVN